MIVIHEKLGEVYGYYHRGIAHINEELPGYLKKHVERYLRFCHDSGEDFRVYFDRCSTVHKEAFAYHANWTGKLEDYLAGDEIADLLARMKKAFPEFSHLDGNELVSAIIALSL